jgi:hypothetical protein
MKARKNLSKQHQRWTQKDLLWAKANYKKYTYKEIANRLKRSISAIRNLFIVKKWAKPKPKWTQSETDVLIKMFGRLPLDKLSKELGKTESGMIMKARRLKIRNNRNGKTE